MKNYIAIIISALVSSLLTVLLCYNFVFKNQINHQPQDFSKMVSNSEIVLSGSLERYFKSSAPNNFIEAANQSKHAVVALRSIQKKKDKFYDNEELRKSNGSGVIIDPKGFIVTNLHVVEDALEIQVTLEDKREYKAEIIGSDEATDLALLKIQGTGLPHLVFGNSDSLYVGEWVLAIGNPFKLQSTVTAGIVSAKARNINILENRGIESFIQTDAAINSGNSGGALINTNGELLGINTAIMTQSGKYEGFSFAVPSNLVRKIIFDIREFGAVQRGWMGVNILNVDNEKAKKLGLNSVKGVYVDVVEREGAAQSAGIRKMDVITTIDGIETNSVPQFMEQLAKFRPGDEIVVEYIRKGQSLNAKLILRNQLNTTDYIAVRKDPELKRIGLELRELDSTEKSRMKRNGVLVVSILNNSIIEYTNMDPGFIITHINDHPIYKVDEVIEVLANHKAEIFIEGFYENYPGEFPYSFMNN